MSKNNQQEMLEVLTRMSAVAAEILEREHQVKTIREGEVESLLSQLKAAFAAE